MFYLIHSDVFPYKCRWDHSLTSDLLQIELLPHLHWVHFSADYQYKIPQHLSKVINIARGTTDPGYRIYNLNKFSGWNQFDIILTKREEERIRLRHIYCGNNWESMVRKGMTQSIGKGSHPLLLHPVIQLVHISLIIGIVDMYKMRENKKQ